MAESVSGWPNNRREGIGNTQSRRSSPPLAELENMERLSTAMQLPELFQRNTSEMDERIFASGYMSDCTVICKNRTWKTHKVILCSRSKWFRAALDGGFEEALTGVVTIHDTNPDVVHAILLHVYTGRILYFASNPIKIMELWRAADFFDIQDLRLAAESAMCTRLAGSYEWLDYQFHYYRTGTGRRQDQPRIDAQSLKEIDDEFRDLYHVMTIAEVYLPENSRVIELSGELDTRSMDWLILSPVSNR